MLVGPAAAQSGNQGGDSFVAHQGDRCVELAVVGDGSQSVEEFYDYRRGGTWGYSSHGTSDLQQTGTSQLFAYRGSNGTSLVFLHDERGDGAGGSGLSMTVRGLPNGSWPVLDDQYNGSDDRFSVAGSPAQLHWMYAQNRTDGAAFRGLDRLGRRDAIQIDPGFGRSSYAGVEANWPWIDEQYQWQARYGEHPNALAPLDLGEPVRIERGSCPGGGDGQGGGLDGNPIERDLEVTDDGYRLSVGSADVGDVVTAEVPDDADDARLRSVELELARDVEDWTVVWERDDAPEDLPGGVSGRPRLVPEEGVGPVRRASYEFQVGTVDAGEGDDGPPPTDVGLVEQRTRSWVVLGDELHREGDSVRVTAASDSLRPVSVAQGVGGSPLPGAPTSSGGAQSAIQLASLSTPERIAPGESAELTAIFENRGVLTTARNVTFAVAGEPIEESHVELPPESQREVTVSHAFERPGTYAISVGNESRTVTVAASAVGGSSGGSPGLGGIALGALGLVALLASLAMIGRWTVS